MRLINTSSGVPVALTPPEPGGKTKKKEKISKEEIYADDNI